MKIKKFEASSMKEALEKIKEDMGPDAFILSTRQINKKGPLGFGDRKFLQVTAAIEEDGEEPPKAADLAGESSFTPVELAEEAPTYTAAGKAAAPKKQDLNLTDSETGATPFTSGFEAVFEAARAANPNPRAEKPHAGMGTENRAEGRSEREGKPLRKEISEIKDMVSQMGNQSTDLSPLQKDLGELKSLLYNVIRNQTPFAGKSISPILFSYYQKFKDAGMDEPLAARLVQLAEEKLSDKDKASEKKVMRYLLAMISQSIDVAGPLKLNKKRGRVIALAGPTGVGKTTTLAKLAAWSSLQAQVEVVLITLDTYRIAAVDQLKTYAKIMEIPIQVALNMNELRQAIQFHQDKSLILIDTAGHSQKDSDSMKNLRSLLSDQQDVEVHLVLSATTKSADLNDIVEKFSVLDPQYLIFTKLDETTSYGPLFTQIVKTRKPVSFITMGQNVPEDFEFANRDLLAGLFLGQSLDTLKGAAR